MTWSAVTEFKHSLEEQKNPMNWSSQTHRLIFLFAATLLVTAPSIALTSTWCSSHLLGTSSAGRANGSAAAQTYKVEKADAPPPEELAAPVRDSMAPGAARILGPDGPLFEIWFRKVVPVKDAAGAELGIAYPRIPGGTLFGAVRVLQEFRDYRRQRIKPGVYTLRYALHPTDGNHMGISDYRDFLVIVPATADQDLAPIAFDDLMQRSRKTTGGTHPCALSLLAAEEAAESPGFTLTHDEASDFWLLHLSVPWQAGSGAPSPTKMVLVVVGFGPGA
jgi:hypothetical protein